MGELPNEEKWEALVNAFSKVKDFVMKVFNTIRNVFSKLWDGLKPFIAKFTVRVIKENNKRIAKEKFIKVLSHKRNHKKFKPSLFIIDVRSNIMQRTVSHWLR